MTKLINIYSSYYAMYKKINPEWQCVSVSNTKPESMFIPVCKDLAPYWSDVDDYKNKIISRETFKQRYIQSLRLRKCDILIRQLIKYLDSSNIVFMCYEKKPIDCHRSILLDYIKSTLPEFNVCGEVEFSKTKKSKKVNSDL